MTKYKHVFRYLFGYAWCKFYFDECINKSYTNINSIYIFDIDTASELPIFPFSSNYPKLNPYMPILVNDNILNSRINFIGFNLNRTNSIINDGPNINGITNLEQFRYNLNVFCTGDSNYNLFEDILFEQDKIAICGSVICACIQKYHPLMNLFNNYTGDLKLKRYYNEYYAKSDIDVMFLTNNYYEFLEKADRFYEQLKKNLLKKISQHTLQLFKIITKNIYIFLSDIDIEDILKSKELDYSVSNIKSDIYNNNMHTIFIDYYKDYIDQYIEYKDIKYDKVNINFRFSNNYLSKININFKYNITSPQLDFPFELFPVKYDDFFASVSRFHLPCVRGFYNGNNVYLTPSCISAHLTFMNLDYKYFSGNGNPIEILNKYRMRGFGTWLNSSELKLVQKYSHRSNVWKRLYNSTATRNICGPLSINHIFFRPRSIIPDEFTNSPVVDFNYRNIVNYDPISNKESYFYDVDNTNPTIKLIMDLEFINKEGFIVPVKKWIIEALWID